MQTGMKTVSGYRLYLYRRSMARNSVAAFSEAVQANRECKKFRVISAN